MPTITRATPDTSWPGVAVRSGSERGWLAVRDPGGEWHEIQSSVTKIRGRR